MAAASACFLMVIYAEITLESIISLLFTVALHNLSHDTDVAVQTGDTMPCFNSSFSPSCVSGRSTVNYILWGYLSLSLPLISRFLDFFFSCINLSKEFFFCKDVAIWLIQSWVLGAFHINQQDCVSQHVAKPLTWSLIGLSDLSRRVVQRDNSSDLVWNLPSLLILGAGRSRPSLGGILGTLD